MKRTSEESRPRRLFSKLLETTPLTVNLRRDVVLQLRCPERHTDLSVLGMLFVRGREFWSDGVPYTSQINAMVALKRITCGIKNRFPCYCDCDRKFANVMGEFWCAAKLYLITSHFKQNRLVLSSSKLGEVLLARKIHRLLTASIFCRAFL